MGLRENFLAEARSWVSRNFKPGEVAQCANFIRHLEPLLPETHKPYDKVYPLSPGYANSLCGPEIGEKVRDPQPGDLVFFTNTYGTFGANTITHVGLMVNANEMIDRSTADAPVRQRGINTFGASLLWGFVRPKLWESGEAPKKLKLFANKNGFKVVVPHDLKAGEYNVEFFSAEITMEDV